MTENHQIIEYEPQMNTDKRRYAPQRTLRTQSTALTIVAVFAPSAVIDESGV